MKRLMLVGASGLVGQSVLRQALAHPQVQQLVAPTRCLLPPHAKLHNPVVDFDALAVDADWWAVDAVICTLGTTKKKSGSQAEFRRVDHDHPLRVAQIALQHGASAYALNSALGADATSRVFYSRTKGELERDLQTLGYPSLTFVRPGLIGGDRQEVRPSERLGVVVLQWLRPLLPARYRVVLAERIAHQLLQAALAGEPGLRVVMSEDID
jgi:uncharacterized protein YbjT (DUF2867 family)